MLKIQPESWYWARPRRRDIEMEQRSIAGRRFSWMRERSWVKEVVTALSQRLWPWIALAIHREKED